jgi:glycosyltransferase involved in cell wall biosynthesis
VPVGDVAALADAIAKLADDADLRRRFGANARDLVEAKFSAGAIGRETVELYRQLIGT